ncbi:putative ribonuclease H-like domain-containing protein [Tanacetum coccineum]
MIGNKSFLTDYQDYDGGFVAFEGSSKGGRITGKGKIKTGKLDFDDVYFVKELKFNLFSVSQMCDNKNSVLFTETECLILSPDFKLPDENQAMLKIPRKDNMYIFNLKNVVSSKGLTFLFAKATNEVCLPKDLKMTIMLLLVSKVMQHKPLVSPNLVTSVCIPFKLVHMDLFGPTFVKSIMGKAYCLVVTDDYNRFSWVFFLAKKDETSGILKNFITGIENQLNHKVKIIRSDNGTEFKNYEMNQFCGIKGIKGEFSNARTPQQNGVAERKNSTLIEAVRTMLADSTIYSFTIWAEAVLFLNPLSTWDSFDGKAYNEDFLVGYSINSKAFRVFNSRTRKVEENLYVNFLENKPNVARSGPEWLFDIDNLTNSMNYQPVSAGNRTNGNAGLETNSDAGQAGKENVPDQEYILLPLLHTSSNVLSNSKKDVSSPKDDTGQKNEVKDSAKEGEMNGPGEATNTDSTNRLDIVSSPVNTVSSSFTTVDPGRAKQQRNEYESLFDPLIPDLEDTADFQDTGIFGSAYDDEYVGAEADLSNLETNMSVSHIPTTKIHKDHPKAQIIREVEAMQEELLQFKLLNYWTLVDLPHGKKVIGTKSVFRNKRDQRGIVVRNKARLVAQGYRQEEGVDYGEVFALVARIKAIRLFLAFASFMGFTMYQMDVKSAFLYGTIEEEVYVSQPIGFVDPEFPNRVYKVEKALYGLHQAHRAWYETLSTYLLENGFRRGTIDKTLFIKKIKNDILLMSSMEELTFFLGQQVEQRKDGIFLSQDKYVYDILKKFGFSSVKTASTPMETHKPLSQDTAGTDVDVHLYRSMIGSLMYLTSSRPDIMFAVCACSRFQVQPKASHMHAVKRIFRYLKGQPTLGLWYPKDSPMDLIAYSDSDYAGASIDRKSTTGGCQFLGCRLISWQCKKQTIVANSTTEAEYIAASNCCGQVLWLQNQLLDYGYNFMKTKIHVDNESAICVIHTDYNVADLLTKAFDVTRFQFLIASIGEAPDVYYALKYDWKDLLHQTKHVKHLGKSKEVGTLRYLSLVVPLTKVGDEAVHNELGDRMERAATTASSLAASMDSGKIKPRPNCICRKFLKF